MRGADDASAECFADRLMPKAHAQDGYFACKMTDQVDADARFVRSTWSGGNDDAFGVQIFDFFQSDLIIAAHFNLRAQFADVLDEVVSERIVVVENENQGCGAPVPSLHRVLG